MFAIKKSRVFYEMLRILNIRNIKYSKVMTDLSGSQCIIQISRSLFRESPVFVNEPLIFDPFKKIRNQEFSSFLILKLV